MQIPEDKYEVAKWMNENMNQQTLPETIGIKLLEVGKDKVVGTLPVGPKTHQPMGILHGGSSVALAETLASIGAWMNIDQAKQAAVGQEINANHIRAKRDGIITGEAVPLHVGRTSQVWDIKLYDEERRLICVSRCTIAVVERK
jgi:uncharacterized protein (TIGR00369 family)